MSQRAIAAYRNLLRAQRKAFNRDTYMQMNAMKEIRKQFEANRNEKDANKIEEMLEYAKDMETFLLYELIQVEVKDGHGKIRSESIEGKHGDAKTITINVEPISEKTIMEEQRKAAKAAAAAAKSSTSTQQDEEPVVTCCGGGCH